MAIKKTQKGKVVAKGKGKPVAAKPVKKASPASAAPANNATRQALGRGLSLLLSGGTVNTRPNFESRPTFEGRATATERHPEERQESAAPREEYVAPVDNTLVYLNKEQAPDYEDSEEGIEGQLQFIELKRIVPNAYQPRRVFRAEDLEDLTRSIAESGVLQPIVVRKAGAGFELIAGERRWRAAERAGLQTIPAVIREFTDKEALGLAIVENVQRADLNAIEEAQSYKRLVDEFKETQEGVAQIVGKDRATVANALRLLKLSPKVQELISSGKLSAGHGRALLTVESITAQERLAEQIISEGLSVRATERLVSGNPPIKAKAGEGSPAQVKSPAVLALEERLRRALGTKVTLQFYEKDKGELRIGFYSQGELENILEQIGA